MRKAYTYMTDNEFKKLSLIKRYNVVSENGNYISKRIYRGMEAYLYKVDDFYVEVWKRYMLNQIEWIEVAPESTINKYVDSVDLKKLLGEKP